MVIVHGVTQTQWKLSNNCSIYTAEALAILKAIEFVANHTEVSEAIILSDCLSSLISLKNHWKPTDIIRKIHNTHIKATLSGKHITYMWIPGHCNIAGNECADKAAKLAHLSDNVLLATDFSYQDAKRVIAKDKLA